VILQLQHNTAQHSTAHRNTTYCTKHHITISYYHQSIISTNHHLSLENTFKITTIKNFTSNLYSFFTVFSLHFVKFSQYIHNIFKTFSQYFLIPHNICMIFDQLKRIWCSSSHTNNS
jgi:hypothetical protein